MVEKTSCKCATVRSMLPCRHRYVYYVSVVSYKLTKFNELYTLVL